MDIDVHTHCENIRKIEDIIDIQKANGNFSCRQVALNLLGDTKSNNYNLANSLEPGLNKTKSVNEFKKKFIKLRPYRQKSPTSDVVSWPSDSDITVLRMKLCITRSNPKERVGNIIPGDGLHQHDSSSMINLATLIRQSQPPSKHSFINEEYLLPLTSWEREHVLAPEPQIHEPKLAVEVMKAGDTAPKYNVDDYNYFDAVCSYERTHYSSKDSTSDYSRIGTVSKLARFLRLYFCPCCTCLYRLEKMKEDPSVYFTNRNYVTKEV